MTGRAAVLLLVLAVLTVSSASSMRAFLEQRDHLNELRAGNAASRAAIEEQLRENRRFLDPAYNEQKARELGYVRPGEIIYTALDDDFEPLDSPDTLSDPADTSSTPDPWMENLWESVEYAGNPPVPEEQEQPAEHIEAPKE